MKKRVLKKYRRERDSDLATTSKRVVEKLKNNPKYPNPPVALSKLEEKLPAYDASLVNARGRDKEMVAIKKGLKAEIAALLTELDSYVTLSGNGDEAMLLSSGFDILGQADVKSMPDIPKLFVELGPPGEVTISVKHVRGARAYMHQYTSEPPVSETVWISEGNTNPNCTFKGLKSFTKYWFRIVALGRNGQMIYSPFEARIVQ
ncbi:fibronectin type III domain-containing protein [Niastella sp. OAS944]|uniref:fibronectin type III domain-containing protein n=1 Tax=Niastella sp. OAS944 TaxID=2664089 RepID=UPI00346CF687|nr:hypothetical protein [Chitinophagaceae bacterium OAS944]